MKRFVALLILALLCAVVAPSEASAQFDLGKALGQLLGAPAQDTSKPSPYDEIRSTAPARSKTLGTWQYKSATLQYLGDNPLAEMALSQLEGYGLAELRKHGIIEGCCSLTLRRNGMAVLSTRDALQDGTINYDETTSGMTLSTVIDGETYNAKGYLRIVSERLLVMIDARDVLKMLIKNYPELATDQTYIMAQGVLQSFGDIYLTIVFIR
ncbi:MAG: DUF4923 family protein [Alistipes sp.]|jgi:hypothetical protein|nr:DUF4923 family protein [Alistipes sp.]MBO5856444.1 DUF4923 family protein [Alistipes sp.]